MYLFYILKKLPTFLHFYFASIASIRKALYLSLVRPWCGRAVLQTGLTWAAAGWLPLAHLNPTDSLYICLYLILEQNFDLKLQKLTFSSKNRQNEVLKINLIYLLALKWICILASKVILISGGKVWAEISGMESLEPRLIWFFSVQTALSVLTSSCWEPAPEQSRLLLKVKF